MVVLLVSRYSHIIQVIPFDPSALRSSSNGSSGEISVIRVSVIRVDVNLRRIWCHPARAQADQEGCLVLMNELMCKG